jgi:hypothetical protein
VTGEIELSVEVCAPLCAIQIHFKNHHLRKRVVANTGQEQQPGTHQHNPGSGVSASWSVVLIVDIEHLGRKVHLGIHTIWNTDDSMPS